MNLVIHNHIIFLHPVPYYQNKLKNRTMDKDT